MWFDRLVIECRDSNPKALGSNPGQAQYFFTTCYTWRPIWGNSYWLLLWHLKNISQCFSLKNSGLNSNLEEYYVAGHRYSVIYQKADQHVVW